MKNIIMGMLATSVLAITGGISTVSACGTADCNYVPQNFNFSVVYSSVGVSRASTLSLGGHTATNTYGVADIRAILPQGAGTAGMHLEGEAFDVGSQQSASGIEQMSRIDFSQRFCPLDNCAQ